MQYNLIEGEKEEKRISIWAPFNTLFPRIFLSEELPVSTSNLEKNIISVVVQCTDDLFLLLHELVLILIII